MKKPALVVAVVFLGIGAAGFWAFSRSPSREELVLSGSIEARAVKVGSLVGGRVSAVHVDEGAAVKAGQPLVTLEPDLIDLQIAEQRARIREAESALTRVESGPRTEDLARSRLDWENAERDRQRLERLLLTKVIGPQEYDKAATRAATTLESYRERERGSRREDVAAARATVDREESRLAYLVRQREETVVKAPAEGVVESLDLRPGDLVPAGQPVTSILEPSELWVRVFVPEPKLGLVKLGQRVDLTVDTFPEKRFPGKIVEIRPRGEFTPRNVQTLDQRSELLFGVKVEIQNAPELKPGMAALVRLVPGSHG